MKLRSALFTDLSFLFCERIRVPNFVDYSNVAACLPAIIPKTMAGPMVEPGPG